MTSVDIRVSNTKWHLRRDLTREEMDLEKLTKEIETKLQLLELKRQKGKEIVAKKNNSALERHVDALVTLAKEVDEIKVRVEEKKLEKGLPMDEVCKWSSEIDENIEGVDAEIEYLRKCLSEARQQLQLAEKEKEDELLSIEREKQLEFEKEN